MESRVRRFAEIAGVIVVQVRENHISDCSRLDAKLCQCFDRTAQERALTRSCVLLCESGNDDKRLVRSYRSPHKVVHRHRNVMRIAAEKMARAACIARAVAQREHFVLRKIQSVSPGVVPSGLASTSGAVRYAVSALHDKTLTALWGLRRRRSYDGARADVPRWRT